MTFKYFPASKILCFQGWRKEGIHAPPGSLFVPSRVEGTPAESDGAPFPLPDEVANEDPSRNYH
jgi:hypothetical protein